MKGNRLPSGQTGKTKPDPDIWENLDGAGEEIRTPDPIITNDVLYQLSYTGAPIKVGAF
ncbi:hypothetical protein AA103587_0977 [Gluconobacter kanchanaburiensis NBRC 103587]|nr:hypothetical protein AA103587_0977 [Gluconobacter kanchanaburiensis NBRC 103587]